MTRGFSLLELIVALGLAGFVLTSVVLVMVSAKQEGIRGEALGEMVREMGFVDQMLAEDIRATGVGVPRIGNNNIQAFTDILRAVVASTPTGFGVVGDRPRPDANYSTFGLLTHRRPGGGDGHHFYFHNENNGTCAPQVAGGCDIALTSVFFPGITQKCNTADTNLWFDTSAGRGCPWGMNRLRENERFQIVSGAGQWVNSQLKKEMHNHGQHLLMSTASDFPGTWPNNNYTSSPLADGEGWVTTLDRVFWRQTGTTLERNHCWGEVRTNSASWPATNIVPANPAGVTNNTCTGWEVMLRDVQSVQFEYFDDENSLGTSATLIEQPLVDRIEWQIITSRVVHGRTIQHAVRGAAAIKNRFDET